MIGSEDKIKQARAALVDGGVYTPEEIDRIIRVMYGDGKVDEDLIIKDTD